MKRRRFVQLLAASSLPLIEADATETPKYRVVTRYQPAASPGMPGPYPGRVIAVKSARCLDESGDRADPAIVREMIERGMRALTQENNALDAWRRFIRADDIVGIKVNAGGRPLVVSAPELVAEVIRNLMAVGVKPAQIFIYERFQGQLDEVNYAPHLPQGVTIVGAESGGRRTSNKNYDPLTYVEADFFGEDDTRSNMIRLVSEKFTKIINIPNMKDHGATGVTGCLKNIAYGSFSNVARTHYKGVSHTRSFVGTLAATEPLRSRTVLQIMDGLRGVWHGGPFARIKKYIFYPKTIMFGTDPVAIDRLLLDIIENERRKHGAISVWDRSEKYLKVDNVRARDADPNVNIIIREPGHIEYAANLGLGVDDLKKIQVQEIEV